MYPFQYVRVLNNKINDLFSTLHTIHTDSTSERHGAQNTISDLFDDADSVNIGSSKMQSSVGSNTVNIRLVNYSDSEDGETVEKHPDEDQGSETSPSPNKAEIYILGNYVEDHHFGCGGAGDNYDLKHNN